jgi:hypothetical protein
MRRGSKPELIYDVERSTNGPRELLGINLSSDYCAEHEWGIKDIREAFGLPDKDTVYGLKKRKITRVPKTLAWVKYVSTWYVSRLDVERGLAKKVGDTKITNEGFVLHDWYHEEPDKMALNSELHGVGLRAAWSEDDFAVISNDLGEIAALREIFDEIQKKNTCIFFGGGGPFQNSALVIAIADRLPKEITEDWFQYDYEQQQIKKEFEATGIEKLLAAAGKRYYALSPRRRDDGSLWYWLNPCEQHKTNYGWFTLEQLQQWAKDEGPIPMKEVKA